MKTKKSNTSITRPAKVKAERDTKGKIVVNLPATDEHEATSKTVNVAGIHGHVNKELLDSLNVSEDHLRYKKSSTEVSEPLANKSEIDNEVSARTTAITSEAQARQDADTQIVADMTAEFAKTNLELEKKSPKLIEGEGIKLTSNPDGTVTVSVVEKDTWEGLKFTAQEDNASISYDPGDVDVSGIQYSYNGKDWHSWASNETLTLINGEHVDVRNTKNILSSDTSYFKFVINNGKIAASGNVNSMINFAELHDNCYAYMFNGCTSLTNAPSLPATTLADGCYAYMFNGCTSLTNAPSLPATTLADKCYNGMFVECTSLTNAPSLPATTLANYCYNSMFVNCTSLTNVPAELLPATTLANGCYAGMFDECTSLTNAPSLPATTLANSCYMYMFNGCTSLKIQETDTKQSTGHIVFVENGITTTTFFRNMFASTGGSFTGTPNNNKYYSYYV